MTMLDATPKDWGDTDRERLIACIEACDACARTCAECADACLSEEMVAELTRCIRTDQSCAAICAATADALARHTPDTVEVTRAFLESCAAVCRACGDECARHADMHEHCRICAEACRRCEQACRDLLATLAG